MFIRPRRFGKRLLLSMLANYYDVAKKDEFDALFGHLKIGKHPTPLRNRFFILKWDFSKVDPMGDAGAIRRALHDHVNSSLKAFIKYYRGLLEEEIEIDPDNAVNSIESLISSVRMTPYPIYLLIDEYDNFANEVMMGVRKDRKGVYETLVYEEGPLKTLFKVVKSSTSESIFDRIFITGVSPVVMSDITSGYNIADNIYLKTKFNDLCGFHEAEIEPAVKEIVRECGLKEDRGAEAVDQMRTWYNGYAFAVNARGIVYNPTLVLYFLKEFQEECQYPIEMLDDNLSTDDAKLEYVSRIPNGRRLLLGLMEEDRQVLVNKLEKRFGIKRMLEDQGKDDAFLASFLYYFGVLTIGGETPKGKLRLRVSNLVMRGLYVERIHQMLFPDPMERDDGKRAAEALYSEGDMAPLCEFV
ncbi:MAG: AAA family ATPase, partial [Desulfobacterales bacterium]|nr:AAA family ATPase [Desulfobacterales bacterium]